MDDELKDFDNDVDNIDDWPTDFKEINETNQSLV